MASISERENREIKAANASGNTPVVFIHGLWLLPGSWASWADFFEQAGYAPLVPDWPDDPETVQQARANPDVLNKDVGVPVGAAVVQVAVWAVEGRELPVDLQSVRMLSNRRVTPPAQPDQTWLGCAGCNAGGVPERRPNLPPSASFS